MKKRGLLLIVGIFMVIQYSVDFVFADQIVTMSIYNDNLVDGTWTEFNNNYWAENSNLVLLFRTRSDYLTGQKLIIDLSDLLWDSWLVSWIPVSKVVSNSWFNANSINILPKPNSTLWANPSNNFEDNLWISGQCSLIWSNIECTVPVNKTFNEFTWVFISWITLTNDVFDHFVVSEIRDVIIWWTIQDQWLLSVALVQTWSTNSNYDQWDNTKTLSAWWASFWVTILTSISIAVENPDNLYLSPNNWNSDSVSVTGTITVNANSPGWYTVASMNDWTWNTLRNILDQSYQISDITLFWASWVLLYDAWFWICAKDDEGATCDTSLDAFRWVWPNWIEVFRDLDDADSTFEVTYQIDVPWTQKAWIYQGIVVFLAAVNL